MAIVIAIRILLSKNVKIPSIVIASQSSWKPFKNIRPIIKRPLPYFQHTLKVLQPLAYLDFFFRVIMIWIRYFAYFPCYQQLPLIHQVVTRFLKIIAKKDTISDFFLGIRNPAISVFCNGLNGSYNVGFKICESKLYI